MKLKNKNILVAGEVLVDIFPEYERIGGAPFNFAFHLNSFGFDVRFLSRVGRDARGKKIIEFMKSNELSLALLQNDDLHPTGEVNIKLNNSGIPDFKIELNSAFDFIEVNENLKKDLKDLTLIYVGTLAQRNDITFSSIQEILTGKNKDTLVFFDVNLRGSFYSIEVIENTLGYTDILKINDDELVLLKSLLKLSLDDKKFIEYLLIEYNIKFLCLTLGENGSKLYVDGNVFEFGKTVRDQKIEDTVGAGDAYSSVLAMGVILNWKYKDIVKRAASFALDICFCKGAVSDDKSFYSKYNKWLV